MFVHMLGKPGHAWTTLCRSAQEAEAERLATANLEEKSVDFTLQVFVNVSTITLGMEF